MMAKELVTVTLTRQTNEAWGFRLAGGKDYGQPLSISQVNDGGLASVLGLNANDLVAEIAGMETHNLTHDQAEQAITAAGNQFQMVIERETDRDRKVSFEKSAQQFSLKLGGSKVKVQKEVEAFISNVEVTEDTPALLDLDEEGVDFKKYDKPDVDHSASSTLEDMAKVYNRKDWNCPWVRKDGRGLKQAIRAVDGPSGPIRTSCKPYYSEPRSILGEEAILTPEQLQKVIEEQGCDSRSNSRMGMDDRSRSRPDSRQHQQESWHQESRQQYSQHQESSQEYSQHQESSQEYSQHHESRQEYSQFNGNSHSSTEHQSSSMSQSQSKTRTHEESYGREREEDSQAPPPLETVEHQERYLEENGMGTYEEEGFEPSADELIDVLKNLENLAAANPGLYKAIVEQIKDNTGNLSEGEETDCIGSGMPNITGTGKISKALKSALKAKQPT